MKVMAVECLLCSHSYYKQTKNKTKQTEKKSSEVRSYIYTEFF